MRRASFSVLVVFGIVAACGGQVGDDSSTNGDAGSDATNGEGGACCPPSATPGCCMSYGGFAQGNACSQVCDGMPSPGDPGWHLGTDAHGCSVWIPPSNPTSTCGQAPGCFPASESGFTPAPMHTPRIIKGACTTTEIDDYFKECINSAGQPCNDFHTNDATCVACLESKDTDSTWGPLVSIGANGMMREFNAAGCIAALTGDSSASGCAQQFDDSDQCLMAACNACLPQSQQDIAAFEQCQGDAQKTVCASWVAAECTSDPSYTTCISSGSNDPETQWNAIAAAMCGP